MLLNHLNLFASFFAADMEDVEAWEYGGIGCHGTLGLAALAVEGGNVTPIGGIYSNAHRCVGEVGSVDTGSSLQVQVTLFPVAGVPLETLYCG